MSRVNRSAEQERALRSRIMSAVRHEGTAPELAVRSRLHRMGLRFRLHAQLPGRPDIVLPRHRWAIFVHGCFWHRHHGCSLASMPSSNVAFWRDKFDRNIARDARVVRELRSLGWRVSVIWECETRDRAHLDRRLKKLVPPSGLRR